MSNEPALVVVMACKDGWPHLVDQLEALCEEQPDCPWQVVVADNGSTDGSVEVMRAYLARLPLTVVDASQRPGQSFARNAGVHASSGDHIVFLDHDDVISPGYLGAMHRAIGAEGFVAATLDSVTLNPAWVVEARGGKRERGLSQGLYPMAAGARLGIRRDLFEAVGGFDEALPPAEDTDLCWRVQRDTGVRLFLCREAVLQYRLRPTLLALFRQGRSYGNAAPIFYRKWASAGFDRLPVRKVIRRWASSAVRSVAGPKRYRRAAGLFLLGENIGRLESSIRHRTMCL